VVRPGGEDIDHPGKDIFSKIETFEIGIHGGKKNNPRRLFSTGSRSIQRAG
jgi:hypothetical protein